MIDASAGYGACSGGSGSFRGKIFCAAPDGLEYVAYGPWLAPAGVPRQSIATCAAGDLATAITFETSENPVIDDPTP